MARHQTITPLNSTMDRGVYLTLTLDRRGIGKKNVEDDEMKFPVVVIVAHRSKKYYYRTGTFVSIAEYDKILKASNKGTYYDLKKLECAKFNNVVGIVRNMLDENSFTLELFKEAMRGGSSGLSFSSLFRKNLERLKSNGNIGTYILYRCVYNKFSSYYGENVTFDKITPQLAIDFKSRMERDGNIGVTTINIYLRALRVHCNIALENGHIKPAQYPFGKKTSNVKIPKGMKRKDHFLTVEEVLRLIEYNNSMDKQTPYLKLVDEAMNLWLFSYLANGMNLADMAFLTYSRHFFKTKGKEFEFVRRKTAMTTKGDVVIYIPVIDKLREIVERFGAPVKQNALVFPQILMGETEPIAVKKMITQFNSNIQDRMKKPCRAIGLEENVSMTWARHSFNTNLAHKKVPESYIGQAMGHSAESITSGYTGLYSMKDRFRYNSLLLDPFKEA